MLPDLRSFLPSVLRTFTPLVVAYLLGFPVVRLLGLDDQHVTALVTVVLSGGYWVVVRVLEVYVIPQFGWLLLWASPPVYVDPAQAGRTSTPAGDVARVVARAGGDTT